MADVQTAPLVDKSVPEKSVNSTGTNGNTDLNPQGQGHQQALQHQSSTGSLGSPEPLPSDDLSEELIHMGWRKYWSKRENMPYYFNKITNESLWEMPQVVHVC